MLSATSHVTEIHVKQSHSSDVWAISQMRTCGYRTARDIVSDSQMRLWSWDRNLDDQRLQGKRFRPWRGRGRWRLRLETVIAGLRVRSRLRDQDCVDTAGRSKAGTLRFRTHCCLLIQAHITFKHNGVLHAAEISPAGHCLAGTPPHLVPPAGAGARCPSQRSRTCAATFGCTINA